MTTPCQRLTVLRACVYAYSTSIHGWGIEGQLTELRADGEGWACTAWVRERGHTLRGGSFYVDSGVRHGTRVKGDDVGTLQVLELCAPAGRWDAVAELVAAADARQRRVWRNRLFTQAWAEQQFRRRTPLALRWLPATTFALPTEAAQTTRTAA